MFRGIAAFLRKVLPSRRRRAEQGPGGLIYETLSAGFSRPERCPFSLSQGASYRAVLSEGPALHLTVLKPSCLAWVEIPDRRYGSLLMEARIRLDPRGGYAAAGLIFRMVDEGAYYLALVSAKGYFRLDVLRSGAPLTLIGWTEIPNPLKGGSLPPGSSPPPQPPGPLPLKPQSGPGPVDLKVIVSGNRMILVINSRWAGDIRDDTIPSGRVGFALASYEAGPAPASAFLEAFSLESRPPEVERALEYWGGAAEARSRFFLAETFAGMGRVGAALDQIRRALAEPGPEPGGRELLLAARLALRTGDYDEAERYAAALEALEDEEPGRLALTERAKILYASGRYAELRDYGEQALKRSPEDPALMLLLGQAHWQLGDYGAAAAAYDASFALDGENGLAALNAAGAWEMLGRREEALDRGLKAGRAFLRAENYNDLGTVAAKLLSLRPGDWEVHALAGKWAFGIENWEEARRELGLSSRLRMALRPPPPPDPAAVFLEALLLIREGRRAEALPLLEEAAALEPDYALFRFRLAETRYLLGGDPRLEEDLEAALALDPENGWILNLAAQVSLDRGDLSGAASFLERAVALLGEVPEIRANRALLLSRRGETEAALAVLAEGGAEDGGFLENCAGNILMEAGRFEEADIHYRSALAAAPDRAEYLCNRASCLMELARYGEADDILRRAHVLSPGPAVLELIAWVAAQKGEFLRAEEACNAALRAAPDHIPSLLTLAWIQAARFRWEECSALLRRLDALPLPEKARQRKEALAARLEEATTRLISCASCGRSWRVPLDPPPVKALRIFAMPPAELPAGTCPSCGKTWCIGCAENSLDETGRFRCPGCGTPLKLSNEGLKKLVADWAAGLEAEQG
ncbi:MAG: tetratricopeptide repeat protein [Spirochaetaceae bacterium]|jgi:tetratricopeptide (TPR) repeat protein|nr:tetratricopeptide repeat protein [Spirochaetaceae bacterium]